VIKRAMARATRVMAAATMRAMATARVMATATKRAKAARAMAKTTKTAMAMAVRAIVTLFDQISQYHYNNSTNGNWRPCSPHRPRININ
jgi:hypothetical protein